MTIRVIRLLALALVLLAPTAAADTLNEELEDAGTSVTQKFRPGVVRYHSAIGTASLDVAINVQQCRGLDIWFNPDFDGTNVTATYTLYNCVRATASASFASECIPLNFSPEGGEADTNIMKYSPFSLQIWNARVKYFGATITAGADTAQAVITCLP